MIGDSVQLLKLALLYIILVLITVVAAVLDCTSRLHSISAIAPFLLNDRLKDVVAFQVSVDGPGSVLVHDGT